MKVVKLEVAEGHWLNDGAVAHIVHLLWVIKLSGRDLFHRLKWWKVWEIIRGFVVLIVFWWWDRGFQLYLFFLHWGCCHFSATRGPLKIHILSGMLNFHVFYELVLSVVFYIADGAFVRPAKELNDKLIIRLNVEASAARVNPDALEFNTNRRIWLTCRLSGDVRGLGSCQWWWSVYRNARTRRVSHRCGFLGAHVNCPSLQISFHSFG